MWLIIIIKEVLIVGWLIIGYYAYQVLKRWFDEE